MTIISLERTLDSVPPSQSVVQEVSTPKGQTDHPFSDFWAESIQYYLSMEFVCQATLSLCEELGSDWPIGGAMVGLGSAERGTGVGIA